MEICTWYEDWVPAGPSRIGRNPPPNQPQRPSSRRPSRSPACPDNNEEGHGHHSDQALDRHLDAGSVRKTDWRHHRTELDRLFRLGQGQVGGERLAQDPTGTNAVILKQR